MTTTIFTQENGWTRVDGLGKKTIYWHGISISSPQTFGVFQQIADLYPELTGVVSIKDDLIHFGLVAHCGKEVLGATYDQISGRWNKNPWSTSDRADKSNPDSPRNNHIADMISAAALTGEATRAGLIESPTLFDGLTGARAKILRNPKYIL